MKPAHLVGNMEQDAAATPKPDDAATAGEKVNLSPSKTADPTRKKTFKIISVKKGGSGDPPTDRDNDADSIDGLDESQTEDISSEMYDTSSKATDMDVQDNMMPLTPDEVTSTTTFVVKQKPDRDSQSRFKVVKIETKEPFRRGKWVCQDFFDPAPVTTIDSKKVTDDSILHSALSDNLTSSSSVHYVHGVNVSSSNIFVTNDILSPPVTVVDNTHPNLTDVFVPIQPAPSNQMLSNYDGVSSTMLTNQMFMQNNGVISSNASFETLAQTGQTNIVQSLPHQSNLFPYAQNGPVTSLFQNGGNIPTSQIIQVPNSTMIAAAGGGQGVIPSSVSTDFNAVGHDNLNPAQNQGFIVTGGMDMTRSSSHNTIGGQGHIPPQSLGDHMASAQISSGNIQYSVGLDQVRSSTSNSNLGDPMAGVAMDESTGSMKTIVQGDTPQDLTEAVETMYNMGLQESSEENVDER